jgi:hypothetical protein
MSTRTLAALALCLAALPAGADIYKYTDENGVVNYTNLPSRVPSKAERIAVEPGSTATNQAAPPAVPAAGARPRAAAVTPAGFPHVDGDTQRKRDDARRQILDSELQAEQKAFEDAKQALNSGQETRLGNERNYQKYLDRVKELQDAVNTHQANLEALQREIGNLH